MFLKTALMVIMVMAVTQVRSQCFTSHDNFSTVPTLYDTSGPVKFALDLFKELYKRTPPEKNLFISPYSVWSSLLLAYLGASGRTEMQLMKVLGVTDKVTALKTWRALSQMYEKRKGTDAKNFFVLANRAYLDPRVPLKRCVVDILWDELRRIDFLHYEEATFIINGFVEERTRGSIAHVVHPSDIDQALMVLVNAAAFKGSWMHQFNMSKTVNKDFYTSPNDYKSIPMMFQEGNFKYGMSRELDAEILELPYSGDTLSMYILLPKMTLDRDIDLSLHDLMARLKPSVLFPALANMWYHQMKVELPRFSQRSAIKGDLKQALFSLGIRDLFGKTADLSTLAPMGGLVVSRSFHHAALQVTEEGTKASAATVFVSLSRTRPPPPKIFRCNRPFVFIIYDKQTNNILFTGVKRSPHD